MGESVFYQRISKLCAEKGISITKLGEEIGKGSATVSGWKKGAIPRADTLRSLAEYFNVSVGYLMGDESIKVSKIHTNNGIIGHTHAPVTFTNGYERVLSKNEIELLNIFTNLTPINQAKVLVFANELKEGIE
jgi:transcriptional regulator with XRE-family HTH domain